MITEKNMLTNMRMKKNMYFTGEKNFTQKLYPKYLQSGKMGPVLGCPTAVHGQFV